MTELVPVKRALLSVSDKTALAEFATALHREFGIELISTGGTAKLLRDAGLARPRTTGATQESVEYPEYAPGAWPSRNSSLSVQTPRPDNAPWPFQVPERFASEVTTTAGGRVTIAVPDATALAAVEARAAASF